MMHFLLAPPCYWLRLLNTHVELHCGSWLLIGCEAGASEQWAGGAERVGGGVGGAEQAAAAGTGSKI